MGVLPIGDWVLVIGNWQHFHIFTLARQLFYTFRDDGANGERRFRRNLSGLRGYCRMDVDGRTPVNFNVPFRQGLRARACRLGGVARLQRRGQGNPARGPGGAGHNDRLGLLRRRWNNRMPREVDSHVFDIRNCHAILGDSISHLRKIFILFCSIRIQILRCATGNATGP